MSTNNEEINNSLVGVETIDPTSAGPTVGATVDEQPSTQVQSARSGEAASIAGVQVEPTSLTTNPDEIVVPSTGEAYNDDDTPAPPISGKARVDANRQAEALLHPKPKAWAYLRTLPAREYLDETVVPLLLSALTQLDRERPPNPVEWLALYLMQEKPKLEEVCTEIRDDGVPHVAL